MPANDILAHSLFWGRLARVLSGSMAASSDLELRRQWVDDLIPARGMASNDGLRIEGVAHLMGNPNGRFGPYRFFTLLPWTLVRDPDRELVIDEIELDHRRRGIRLVVAGATEEELKQAADPKSPKRHGST